MFRARFRLRIRVQLREFEVFGKGLKIQGSKISGQKMGLRVGNPKISEPQNLETPKIFFGFANKIC